MYIFVAPLLIASVLLFTEGFRMTRWTHKPVSFQLNYNRRYQITRQDYIEKMRQLNVRNQTESPNNIRKEQEYPHNRSEVESPPRIRINIHKNHFLQALGIAFENQDQDDVDPDDTEGEFEEDEETNRRKYVERE